MQLTANRFQALGRKAQTGKIAKKTKIADIKLISTPGKEV